MYLIIDYCLNLDPMVLGEIYLDGFGVFYLTGNNALALEVLVLIGLVSPAVSHREVLWDQFFYCIYQLITGKCVELSIYVCR